MRDVTGKVAFITGGASGMGLAMARSFAAAGMKVAIADIEQDALDRVKAEFDASNAEVITLQVDVTDRAAMEAAADATEAAFDKVHVLVNNAGVAVGGSLDQMSYEDWDWVMGVNLDGVVNGLQAFVQRIKAHGEGGHVVNTASLAGHFAIPGLGVIPRPNTRSLVYPKRSALISNNTILGFPCFVPGWSTPIFSIQDAIGPAIFRVKRTRRKWSYRRT